MSAKSKVRRAVRKAGQALDASLQPKPSRHAGTELLAVGGPLGMVEDGEQKVPYRGRKFLLRGQRGGGTTGKPLEQTIGEYRLDSRPLGNKQGYLWFYQWFGRTE